MANEESAEEDVKPAGGKSKLILILVIVNILAVAGLGAYMALFQNGASADELDEGDEEEEEEDDDPNSTEYGPLVEMQALVANLNDTSAGRFIRVTLHLEVKNEETKLKVEELKVPIRNRLLIYFSELTVESSLGSERKEEIRADLVKAINEVLGKKMVKRVFYTEFVVQ